MKSTAILRLKTKLLNWKAWLFGFPLVSLIALSAVYVAHGDILYDADIARDFLLYQEILEKKFVLIGPRSGAVQGFFHGPLWSYLNFPAFWIGGGNPVAVGWFWVILNIFFVASTFWIGKKFFGKLAGAILATSISVPMIGLTRGFFNPSGALIIMPIFLGTLLLFITTKKYIFLFFHALLIGAMIQFQIAIGGPFLILSSLLIFWLIANRKADVKSLFVLPAFLLPLFSYFLFDIRHNFSLLKAALAYLSGAHSSGGANLASRVTERVAAMTTTGTFFLPGNFSQFSPIIFW